MSALLQICFVIVTLAVVAIAIATIKVMQHFGKASDEFSQLAVEGRDLIDQLKNVAREAGEIVGAFREVAPRVRRVMERFESLGERTMNLSDALIHEVEVPIRTAVAMARGVRFGALQLIGNLTRRFTGRSSTNGGINYE